MRAETRAVRLKHFHTLVLSGVDFEDAARLAKGLPVITDRDRAATATVRRAEQSLMLLCDGFSVSDVARFEGRSRQAVYATLRGHAGRRAALQVYRALNALTSTP